MSKRFTDFDMTPFCNNDGVYCKCRSCTESQINKGDCSHCFTCINGERAMDICEEYKKLTTTS